MEILKFSAAWCGPCKAYTPIFENVSAMKQYKDITFKEFDVDKDVDVTDEYRIQSIPTTIFLKDKKEVNRITGTISEQHLVKIIDEEIKKSRLTKVSEDIKVVKNNDFDEGEEIVTKSIDVEEEKPKTKTKKSVKK